MNPPATSAIRALIFDLDDTLLIDEEISQATLEAVAKQIGVIDVKNFVSGVRVIAKQKWQAGPCYPFCRSIGISAMECLWGNFFGETKELLALRAWALAYRQEVFHEALPQFFSQNQSAGVGCALELAAGASDENILKKKRMSREELESLAKECAAFFEQERRARQTLFPVAAQLLQELASRYRLGLLTNGAPDLQREKIAASGLQPFFSAILISGEEGIGKPQPAIFEKMLQQLEVAPAEALMIGNSLERDIAGAHAAGIRSVWIDLGVEKESEGRSPDFVIASLEELHALIENNGRGS